MTIPDGLFKIQKTITCITHEDNQESFKDELSLLDSRIVEFILGDEFEFFSVCSIDIRKRFDELQNRLRQTIKEVRKQFKNSSKTLIEDNKKNILEITEKVQKVVSECQQFFPKFKDFNECMQHVLEDAENVSRNIEKYQLPEELRAKVAVAAAAENPNEVLKHFKNFQITEPALLLTVFLAIISNSHKISSENEEFVWYQIKLLITSVIKESRLLYKFLHQLDKILGTSKNSQLYQKHIPTILRELCKNRSILLIVSQDLSVYQIKNEEVLFELMMEIFNLLKKNTFSVIKFAQNYHKHGIKNPEFIILFCNAVANLPINGEKYGEIHEWCVFIQNLRFLVSDFGFSEEAFLKYIQKLYAIKPEIVLESLSYLPFSEQRRLEFIIEAIKANRTLPIDFSALGINDLDMRFQIAEMIINAKSSLDLTILSFYFMGLENDQKRLISLAENLYKIRPNVLAIFLFRLGIEDLALLKEKALLLIDLGYKSTVCNSLAETPPKDEEFVFWLAQKLADVGCYDESLYKDDKEKQKLLIKTILNNSDHALKLLSPIGNVLDQETFFKTLLDLIKIDPIKVLLELSSIDKYLTPEQVYTLTQKAIESSPYSVMMEIAMSSLKFADVQIKIKFLFMLFLKSGERFSILPPNIAKFLNNDPGLLKAVHYVQFSGRNFDIGTAKIDPSLAPNKSLSFLLEVLQKLASNLDAEDQAYKKMVEWVIYFDLMFRGSELSEKQLETILPIVRQILELRIPSMRYLLTNLLLTRELLPVESQRAAERLNKILTAEHTHLFKLILRPLYEENSDKDWSFIEILNEKSYLNFSKHNNVLIALKALNDIAAAKLNSAEKFLILQGMFTCSPEALKRLRISGKSIDDKDLKPMIELINYQLTLLTAHINSGVTNLVGVRKAEELEKLLLDSFGEYSAGIDDFGSKYDNLTKNIPIQYKLALSIYSQCFDKYASNIQSAIKVCFKGFFINLLEGRYKQYRYSPTVEQDKNWEKVSTGFPEFVEEWQKGDVFSCKQLGDEIELDQIKDIFAKFSHSKSFANYEFVNFILASKTNQEKLKAKIEEALKAKSEHESEESVKKKVEYEFAEGIQEKLKHELEPTIKKLKEQQKQLSLAIPKPGETRSTETQAFKEIKLQIALLELLSHKTQGKRALLVTIKSLFNQMELNFSGEKDDTTDIFISLNSIQDIGIRINEKIRVIDTDDWLLLLLMGTQTYSCQNISGYKDGNWHNRALLSYVVDPSNRMIAIVDEDQQIQARAITRLMIESEKGTRVLYLEGLYKQASAPENAGEIILRAAKKRAEKLNIQLIVSDDYCKNVNTFSEANQFEAHTDVLMYLGGRAPCHNVDTGHMGTFDTNAFQFPPHGIKYLYYQPAQARRGAEKERKEEKA